MNRPLRKTADVMFPQTREQFHRVWPDFQKWLMAKGSEVMEPEGYELARFTTPKGVGKVLRNANGVITAADWQGGSASAFIAWKRHDKDWRVGQKTAGVGSVDRAFIVATLIARDGLRCCYCGGRLTHESLTVEHFVARTCHGPNHLANLGLACLPCNKAAGHQPVMKKIEFAIRRRDTKRAAFEQTFPAAAARLWDFIARRAGR